MILIETKVDGTSVYAKIREHSLIERTAIPGIEDVNVAQAARPHGAYWKLAVQGRKYAIHSNGGYAMYATLTKIGSAWGVLDSVNLQVLRVDVNDNYQGRGFGLALMQALLQKSLHHGVVPDGAASLIADESETAGLRSYYRRMGFAIDADYGATDHPQQYPMKTQVSVAITNIQVWRAARYSANQAHIVYFS